MPVTTYHIRIKKSYAAAILKDLQKLDAVELLPETEAAIPEWQKKEVRKRIREVQKNPAKAVSWEEAQKKIKLLAK
jgi:Putative addiction module component